MPYSHLPESEWSSVTAKLVNEHPLRAEELVEIVLASWSDVLTSSIGKRGFKIGTDIRPKPQIMAFILEELIVLEIINRHGSSWQGEKSSADKDCNYRPDSRFSFEIKASSHKDRIFGNRSYANPGKTGKKAKSGYYLAINFEDCRKKANPEILMIRFGWLDSGDWVGQKSESGQQSSLPLSLERSKLQTLFPKKAVPAAP